MNSNKDIKSKKNKAVKFMLVPRPQKDPLAADFEAPQHILLPKDGTDIEQIRERFPGLDSQVFASKKETRTGMLERAHNADGMTFDSDILEAMSKDFDYEDPNNVLDDDFVAHAGGLIEEEGEMLDDEMNDITAELFDAEPEVIAFDSQDENGSDDLFYDSDEYNVEQDEQADYNPHERERATSGDQGKKLILFKRKANKLSSLPSEVKASDGSKSIVKLRNMLSEHDDSENFDDDQSERRSVFTNYSLTSSVNRRNQGLQQIDEHFERLYEKEYADDTEIGPLDLNEVKGGELLTSLDQIQQLKKEVKIVRKRNHGDDYQPEIVSDHHKDAIIGDQGSEDEDLVEVEVNLRKNTVDCESILSYNSNLYNHPKLIVESMKKPNSQSGSNQMDMECSDTRSRSGKGDSIATSRATVLSKLSIRPPNETPEERRARKKALKNYRNERRQERKQNQRIFKSEHEKLVKQNRTNQPALKLA